MDPSSGGSRVSSWFCARRHTNPARGLPEILRIPGRSASRSRLLRAYRATRYVVRDAEIRIGRHAPAMDALLRRHRAQAGVLLTAWNPFSRRMPAAWNRRMQRRLAERLRHVVTLPADGAFRRWHEAHLLALSSPARMLPLARRFRQHAVVVVRVAQPARLLWLDRGRPSRGSQ